MCACSRRKRVCGPLWDPDLFSRYPYMETGETRLYYPVAWLLLALP